MVRRAVVMLVKGQNWEKDRPRAVGMGPGLGEEEGVRHVTVCLACVSIQRKEDWVSRLFHHRAPKDSRPINLSERQDGPTRGYHSRGS